MLSQYHREHKIQEVVIETNFDISAFRKATPASTDRSADQQESNS